MGPKADAKDIGSGPLQSGEFRDEDDEEVEMPDVDEQMNAPEVPSLQQQRLLDVLEDALFQFEEEQDDAEEVVEEQEEVSAEGDEMLQYETDESSQLLGSGDIRPNRIVAPNEDPKFVGSSPLGSGDIRDPIVAPTVAPTSVQIPDMVGGDSKPEPLGSGDFRPSKIYSRPMPVEENIKPEPLGSGDIRPLPAKKDIAPVSETSDENELDSTQEDEEVEEIISQDVGELEDSEEDSVGPVSEVSDENELESAQEDEEVEETTLHDVFEDSEEDKRRWKVMDGVKELADPTVKWDKEWLPPELEDALEETVEIPKEKLVGAPVKDKKQVEAKDDLQKTTPQESAQKESVEKPISPVTSSSSSEPPSERDELSPPSSEPPGSAGQTFDLPVPHAFDALFDAASRATVPRAAVDMAGAHDKFRFEWGTWIDDDAMNNLMERIDEVRLERGAYETLLADSEKAVRYRVASGTDWEAILHVLPPGESQPVQWTTGSWVILKCLTGLSEIAIRRGPDRDGKYKKLRPRELRGGGDGTLGGGRSTAGADCIKYVGGPERCYDGKAGKTVLLEMILSPPVGERKSRELPNDEGADGIPALENIAETLSIAVIEKPKEESEEETKVQEQETSSVPPPSSSAEKLNDTNDSQSDSLLSTSEEKMSTSEEKKQRLNDALGIKFEKVGGLDAQLDAIARRVLASRANPEAARRLGVSHVRGVLLSGPPGCGKTLLARELAQILGAREPQIVNGPEILDKFIGEAEKKVRDLFAPAEAEFKEVGDDSALHIIILDEMDAIARKRGSMTSDTTGVRDSVVNQLLAKMDGVKEASNVLVVGLTNRPELLDPALLRPGRLEVQLRVELPDRSGRRDILRIHTRQMREAGAISDESLSLIESLGDGGLAANTEHFTGAELAGLVRSAASFALARAVENEGGLNEEIGMVTKADLERALGEVRPALGKQDEVLRQRYPLGISSCCPEMERIQRDLKRFTAPPIKSSVDVVSSQSRSLMLVGAGGNGGAGVTALAAWASACASTDGSANYVRFITALDILVDGSGGSGDEARASALADKFAEAKEMSHALLVLDDVDQLCAGDGPGGYSTVMLATLRALLRSPPATSTAAKAGGESMSTKKKGRSFMVIATTSRSDAACRTLHELFDETLVVPLLSKSRDVEKLIGDCLPRDVISDPQSMAEVMIKHCGSVGCKTALRLAEQAVSTVDRANDGGLAGSKLGEAQVAALKEMLEDISGDKMLAQNLCEVFP